MIGGKPLFAFIGGGAAGAAQALTSATDIHVFTIPFKCIPIRAGVVITTTISSTGNTVVKFDKRPTAGSDVGRGDGDVGTLTIATGKVAGTVAYEDTDFVDAATGAWVSSLNEGDQVVVQVVTAASSAGQGVPYLLVEISPEMPANNSAMFAA